MKIIIAAMFFIIGMTTAQGEEITGMEESEITNESTTVAQNRRRSRPKTA